jgi:amino acid permease
MPSLSISQDQEVTRRLSSNYGSLRDGRSQAISIGAMPGSHSSWASSYSRAVGFQFYRDRAPSMQLDDQQPIGDMDDDMLIESEYFTTSPTNTQAEPEQEYNESDELIVKIIPIAKSTFAQSLFNSVNILMGIGLLSLPFAFNITGWVVGLTLLGLFAIVTHHTARILQLCLDYQKEDGTVCNTFGDIGEMAFGSMGRTGISFLFFFELVAACIALIILSADSIVALFPGLDIVWVKISIVILVFPLTIPKSLSFASYGSLLGILALFNLMGILIFDGLTKFDPPGSIWAPATTYVMPIDWYLIPLAFGLLMAGFSGHSVFPNLYRDMARPSRYSSLVNWTYLIIIILYILIASLGYIMFGVAIREEVLFLHSGYSKSSINYQL